jgi:hypothetical protein
MTIVKLRTTLPSPDQPELGAAQLCALLRDLTVELIALQSDLIKAGNAPERAAAARRTADKLAQISAASATLSDMVREAWCT